MTNDPPLPWISLQKAVQKADLTYTALAARAGISRAYVSHLANGRRRPTAHIVSMLANALGVPIDEIDVDVSLATTPQQMLDEVDALVNVLDTRLTNATNAVEEIKAKRAYLQQLVQVPA